MDADANLFHVVLTRIATSRFPRLLNCWQEEANKDSDNSYNDKQFDQSESSSLRVVTVLFHFIASKDKKNAVINAVEKWVQFLSSNQQ